MIYTGLDKGEEIVKQRKLSNNGEIVEFLQELGKPVMVAIEATRSWYWLYDLLGEKGIEVRLCLYG